MTRSNELKVSARSLWQRQIFSTNGESEGRSSKTMKERFSLF
jgi:hypothetical protein